MFVSCLWEIGTVVVESFPHAVVSNLCRLMNDPWEGYPPIDLELLALLRAPIKLEPISPPFSPGHFFNEPITRYKYTTGSVIPSIH